MNCAGKARELLLELQRSEWLPLYNDDGVKVVVNEISELNQDILKSLEIHEGNLDHASLQCALIVHHRCMLRNKRCILTYLQYRLDRIKSLRWQVGSVIPEHLQTRLSTEEIHFFSSYDRLLADYMTEFDLDLTADMQPPKDLFIEVRVLKNCGEIYTESGAISLETNDTHFLRRSDVEHLIRQGMLEHIRNV